MISPLLRSSPFDPVVVHMWMVGGEFLGFFRELQTLRGLLLWGKPGSPQAVPIRPSRLTPGAGFVLRPWSLSATCWRGAENSQGGPRVKQKKGGDVRFFARWAKVHQILPCNTHANRRAFGVAGAPGRRAGARSGRSGEPGRRIQSLEVLVGVPGVPGLADEGELGARARTHAETPLAPRQPHHRSEDLDRERG